MFTSQNTAELFETELVSQIGKRPRGMQNMENFSFCIFSSNCNFL